MLPNKEELERTQRQTEQNLQLFEELTRQQAVYEQRRDTFAKQFGAASLDEISQAQRKSLNASEQEYLAKEEAAFKEELRKDLDAAAEQARQRNIDSVGTSVGRMRRMGRMI